MSISSINSGLSSNIGDQRRGGMQSLAGNSINADKAKENGSTGQEKQATNAQNSDKAQDSQGIAANQMDEKATNSSEKSDKKRNEILKAEGKGKNLNMEA